MQLHFLALLTCICCSTGIWAQDAILGKWKTIDDETGKPKSIVKIYKAKNGKIYGKVDQLLDKSSGDDPVCTKCNDDRKGQKIKGMTIIRGLKKSGNAWKGGKILDPANGKEYTCKLWLEGKKLKVRGYWGLLYRTQTWHPQ